MSLRFAAAFLVACFAMTASANADIFTADVDNNGSPFSASVSGPSGVTGTNSATFNFGSFTFGGEAITITADIDVVGGGFFHTVTTGSGSETDNVLGVWSDGDTGLNQVRIEGGEGLQFSNVTVTSASGNVAFKTFRSIGFADIDAGSTADFDLDGTSVNWTQGASATTISDGDAIGTVEGFDVFDANGSSDVTTFEFAHTGGFFRFSSIEVEVVAVPEPSSLLALGLLGTVAFVARRKKS